jgi:ArsR family transcriptional regulator
MRVKNFNLSSGTQIFKSLSDEARVRILNLLFHCGELCISDLEQILDFTQTKTSRHLIYLKNAGIVSFRKTDQWVFYAVKEEITEFVNRIFEYVRKDQTLQNDIGVFNTLQSNRELASSKLKERKLVSTH